MANEPRHLTNAPIVEAMIAFDFVVSGGLDDLRNAFLERIRSRYPNQAPIQKAEITFNAEGSTGKTNVVGARCVSLNGKNVCAMNENSFICSRLHPYENWEIGRASASATAGPL